MTSPSYVDVRQVLSTPIVKIQGPDAFRHGPAHVPVEQYGFRVGSRTVERFADAAALVLRKHKVRLSQPDAEGVQQYVRRAFAIIEGEEELRTFNPSEDFAPARKSA